MKAQDYPFYNKLSPEEKADFDRQVMLWNQYQSQGSDERVNEFIAPPQPPTDPRILAARQEGPNFVIYYKDGTIDSMPYEDAGRGGFIGALGEKILPAVVRVGATAAGAVAGGPAGAALASALMDAPKIQKGEWGDVLRNAAISGVAAYAGGQLSPGTGGITAANAAGGAGATSGAAAQGAILYGTGTAAAEAYASAAAAAISAGLSTEAVKAAATAAGDSVALSGGTPGGVTGGGTATAPPPATQWGPPPNIEGIQQPSLDINPFRGADAGGLTFTPEELALVNNSINFGGEGALGIGGAGSTAAAGVVGNAALMPVIETVAAKLGITLTQADINAAAVKLAAAAAEKAKEWGPREYLAAASLALTAGSTIAAIANAGDQTTSATTTTTPTGPGANPMPGDTTGTGQTAGQKTFDDYINDFYGLTGGKSVQERTTEDQAALTGYQQTLLDALTQLGDTRLSGTQAAVAPYQNQLTDVMGQLSGNRGLGQQVSFGFGGQPMASFVPKANRNLADQLLGMGRESSNIGTGLVDMGYQTGTDLATRKFGFESENLPNKAADTYSARLADLMKYLNPNTGQTSTTTGTVPGVPWYTQLLQGINTGVNFYDKIYNPRQSSYTLTPEQIAKLGA